MSQYILVAFGVFFWLAVASDQHRLMKAESARCPRPDARLCRERADAPCLRRSDDRLPFILGQLMVMRHVAIDGSPLRGRNRISETPLAARANGFFLQSTRGTAGGASPRNGQEAQLPSTTKNGQKRRVHRDSRGRSTVCEPRTSARFVGVRSSDRLPRTCFSAERLAALVVGFERSSRAPGVPMRPSEFRAHSRAPRRSSPEPESNGPPRRAAYHGSPARRARNRCPCREVPGSAGSPRRADPLCQSDG